VQTAIPFSDGADFVLTKSVDLGLPVRGLRVVCRGRLKIGTANMTSVNPEGLLNMLAGIKVEGVNSRANSQITLWDLDLASIYGIQHLFAHRAGYFVINGTHVSIPGTPFPAYQAVTDTDYDFEIGVDLPFHPFACPDQFKPGYLVREDEWSDTVGVSLKFGSQAGAGGIGFLGTAAGGTTVALKAFGADTGNATVDVYSLPVQMGSLRDSVLPGIVSRVARPINTVLQAAGSGVSLMQLQKTRTSRIFLKTGTSVAPPAFATLNDTNVTALALMKGTTNAVKPMASVAAYKVDQAADYQREAIQGYLCVDFLQGGNPDSSLAAQSQKVVGAGSTLDLIANVAGLANGYGLVIQEQITHLHSGRLYTF
jgi:hypothetical protein